MKNTKKICLFCNEEFIDTTTNEVKKYCSLECKRKKWTTDNPNYSRELYKKEPERFKKYQETYRKKSGKYLKNRILNKKCLVCGKDFIDKTTNNNKKYCSVNCKRVVSDKNMIKNHGINYKLHLSISNSLWRTIKKEQQTNQYLKTFGYTIEDLKKHLKSKFKDNMNFENYGTWHVDHIRPVSSFNLSDKEELKKCWALENLQPLLAIDNIKKNDIWEGFDGRKKHPRSSTKLN